MEISLLIEIAESLVIIKITLALIFALGCFHLGGK